jgi:hypothetical protein
MKQSKRCHEVEEELLNIASHLKMNLLASPEKSFPYTEKTQ